VRRFDRDAGEADFDVYLHEGNGPAARWADTVEPGAELELGGRNRSTFAPDDDCAHYLFAGDPSALPAIATCLETLPATASATVVATTDDLPFDPGRADVRVVAGDDAFVAATVEAAAERAWVACEATVMRRVRAQLLDRYGRERLSTRGYWKRGEANHPDHDTGEDE
jgi:NADPH-dependent ferric siderophore reductase